MKRTYITYQNPLIVAEKDTMWSYRMIKRTYCTRCVEILDALSASLARIMAHGCLLGCEAPASLDGMDRHRELLDSLGGHP